MALLLYVNPLGQPPASRTGILRPVVMTSVYSVSVRIRIIVTLCYDAEARTWRGLRVVRKSARLDGPTWTPQTFRSDECHVSRACGRRKRSQFEPKRPCKHFFCNVCILSMRRRGNLAGPDGSLVPSRHQGDRWPQRPTKIHVPFCTMPGTVYLGSICNHASRIIEELDKNGIYKKR